MATLKVDFSLKKTSRAQTEVGTTHLNYNYNGVSDCKHELVEILKYTSRRNIRKN